MLGRNQAAGVLPHPEAHISKAVLQAATAHEEWRRKSVQGTI
jgi:hypothetical protein